ncbi:ABC transporter substrate-binding protein [Candidatus Leptofilum sp.]|uniref:ABC transporter substrate-binding protein n=1 Tax=Candidatus Leptofilum sp. TaxID=3241576 RepID=UPI003B5C6149
MQAEPEPTPAAQQGSSTDSPPAIPDGVSDDTIVLGVSAAFQGTSAGLGTELYRGAQAYFASVNENGGVGGRQVVLRVYNDGYSPDPAVENTITLIEEDDIFLLFNYVGTPTVTRVLPLLTVYEEQSMFLFFPFTGAEPQRNPPYHEMAFNLRASYRQEIAGLVENLIAEGHTRIAVFYQADAYGRSGWDGVVRALEHYGLDIVAEATYTRGADFETSFSEQVDILSASEPDAIIEIGSYQACGGFIRDARDAGLDVPILNVSFVGTENLLEQLKSAGEENGRDYTENLIISQVVPYYNDTALPAVQEYQALMDKYNPSPPAGLTEPDYQSPRYSFVSFEGFLNAKLMVEILKQLGTNPTREQIPAAVESIQAFDLGIDVPVSFGPDRHQGLDVVYYTTIEDGQIVPLVEWQETSK